MGTVAGGAKQGTEEAAPPAVEGVETTAAWLQDQITSYQEAIAQWQVWGQEKTDEVIQLQESVGSLTEAYNSTTTAYNEAVGQLDQANQTLERLNAAAAASEQKPEKHDDKVNEVLKLMKIKDMELEELKETIDRLETEKEDLNEEFKEAKGQLIELEGASETMEAYKATLDQLEETKVSYDKAKEEEGRLAENLDKLRLELDLAKNNAAVETSSLHQALNDKTGENTILQQQVSSSSSKVAELEKRLEEELKMQEEAAQEFDAMQQEVLNAREQASTLNSQLTTLQAKCAENEVLVKELEALKAQAMDESLKRSEERIEELTQSAVSPDQSEIDADKTRITALEVELESCRQYLNDWTVWSETKTQEYNQLLEAYNQYVEAYNTMSTEYNSLKETTPEDKPGEDVDALKTALMAKEDEVSRLSIDLLALQGQVAERDAETDRLTQELTAREHELVNKTGQVAKLSIQSHLGKLMVAKQEPTSISPEQKPLSVHKGEEVSVAPETIHGVKEEEEDWTESEGWGADAEPEAGIAVPEAVHQLELEISDLRQQIKGLEASKETAETEVNNSKLKNGKLLVKVKALTKQVETLKQQQRSGSSAGGGDDLDRALEEEMNNQVKRAKAEVQEISAELENVKTEKAGLEKRADTLTAANNRLVEMKEQQDSDLELLRTRNKEIREQVDGLQWQLAEIEERSRAELAELQVKLSAYEENRGLDTDAVLQDNARLRQELANTSQELSSSQQSADTLREELSVLAASLAAAREEAGVWRSHAAEAKEEIESLKLHIETLQNEKGGSEEYVEARRLNDTLSAEIQQLKQLVTAHQPSSDMGGGEVDQYRERIRREQQLVLQLEQDLQNREAALEFARAELDQLRGSDAVRTRRESTDSRFSVDRELNNVFMDQDVFSENMRLRTDLDNSIRENRRLSRYI